MIAIVQLVCRIHDEPCPNELNELRKLSAVSERDEDTGNESGEANDENVDEDDDDFESECEDNQSDDDNDGIDDDNDDDDDDNDDDDEMFEMNAGPSCSSTV